MKQQQPITEAERILYQLWGVTSPEKMAKMKRSLTLEETKQYLGEWREFGNQEALGVLLYCNDRLVSYYVKKYLGKGLSFEELQSAGRLGLFNALGKFDYQDRPMTGFPSYISVSILSRIRNEFRAFFNYTHMLSFSKREKNNSDDFGLDTLIGYDSDQLINCALHSSIQAEILKSLQTLSPKQRQIIIWRFGLGQEQRKTQVEIARILGCSSQDISQQEKRALLKLKKLETMEQLKD